MDLEPFPGRMMEMENQLTKSTFHLRL